MSSRACRVPRFFRWLAYRAAAMRAMHVAAMEVMMTMVVKLVATDVSSMQPLSSSVNALGVTGRCVGHGVQLNLMKAKDE